MAQSIEESLKPGKRSGFGFLGEEESFAEIVSNDSQTLDECGIQHSDISSRLQYFVDKASLVDYTREGDYVIIDGKYKLTVISWLGYQNCPWDDGEKTDKAYFIKNTESGKSISFSGLIPHLVTEHRFFEGKGTSYRLDPLEAILVLDIHTPKISSKEIEERIYEETLQNLQHPSTSPQFEYALVTVSWFKEKYCEQIVSALINLIPQFYKAAKRDTFMDKNPITYGSFCQYLETVSKMNDPSLNCEVKNLMSNLYRGYLETDGAYTPGWEYMLRVYYEHLNHIGVDNSGLRDKLF